MRKYLGLKKASDLNGRRVVSLRQFKNGYVVVPAYSTGTIDTRQFVRDGKIDVTFDKCSCCGVAARMGGLCYNDLILEGDELVKI